MSDRVAEFLAEVRERHALAARPYVSAGPLRVAPEWPEIGDARDRLVGEDVRRLLDAVGNAYRIATTLIAAAKDADAEDDELASLARAFLIGIEHGLQVQPHQVGAVLTEEPPVVRQVTLAEGMDVIRRTAAAQVAAEDIPPPPPHEPHDRRTSDEPASRE